MKSRHFTSLRMVALALMLSLGLVNCGKGCSNRVEESASGKNSFELIPADSNLVMGLNVKKANESPWGAKIAAEAPPELAPMLKEVTSMVFGMKVQDIMGKGGASSKNNKDFVGIISGNLDPAKVLAQMQEQAKKEGTTVSEDTYEGIKLYSPAKEPDFAVSFVDSKVVFGGKETVKKAIDLSKKKGDNIEKNKVMMDLIDTMDKGKILWAVGQVPPDLVPAGSGGPGNPMAALVGMKAVDLAIDYNDNLLVDLGVVTASKENAEQLKTMSNSYKTLFAGSFTEKEPALGKVLNGLTIDAKGDKVLLSLKLDQATVDELTKKAAAQSGALPGVAAPAAGSSDAVPPSAPVPPAALEAPPAVPSAP